MIHNVLITTLTPLSKTNEISCWENMPFTTVWPENVQQKQKGIIKPIKKKKPKRARTAFTTDQLRALEKTFCQYKYIDSERRRELSKALNIADKCVKIWFQNRRMKEKKESSESSSDSSNESVCTEAMVSQSPPLQDQSINYPARQYQNGPVNVNYSYHYQLPTYHYPNEILPNVYEGEQGANAANFYYDNNVYPTQYYPNENSQFDNEPINDYQQFIDANHSWAPYNPYYFTA